MGISLNMMRTKYKRSLADALQAVSLDIEFTVLKDSSTNIYASCHCPQSIPYLIVAISQKDGQGRRGHKFESAKGGAYFTLQLLAPQDFAPERYTITAGVAVACVLQDLPIKLKWPNDIYINGKKLGGILCSSRPYNDKVLINCGIGINVNNKVSVKGATRLADYNTKWNEVNLIANITKTFLSLLNLEKGEIFAQYKKYSNVLGQQIIVTTSNDKYVAYAKDLAECGNLIVEKNGSILHLSCADVSLLPIKDT